MLFGEKSMAIWQLRCLVDDCDEPDWDGNAAYAIGDSVFQKAEEFVRSLPYGIPAPECAPEPDGSISLDWIQSRNRMFSLSIGSDNRLAYAWLDGTDKGHGVVCFDGLSIPARVLSEIQRTMGHADAPLRIA
jgi:hypothetical protein